MKNIGLRITYALLSFLLLCPLFPAARAEEASLPEETETLEAEEKPDVNQKEPSGSEAPEAELSCEPEVILPEEESREEMKEETAEDLSEAAGEEDAQTSGTEPEELSENSIAFSITSISLYFTPPECGTGLAEGAGPDIFCYAGRDSLKEEDCWETETAWRKAETEGNASPDVFAGGELYEAEITVHLKQGTIFSPLLKEEDIDFDSTLEEVKVKEFSSDTLSFLAWIRSAHQIDWDTYEEKESTCIEKGYKKYRCTGCDQFIEEETEIDENAHDWGEWTVVKSSTVLEEGERMHQCGRCGREENAVFPRLYSETYQPETSWIIPAAVGWNADESIFDAAQQSVRPAVAFVHVDAGLRIYDRNHGLISESIEEYVRRTAPTIIPAFLPENEEAGNALAGWLSESGFSDCFIGAAYENAAFVKPASSLPHVRGMLDYSAFDHLDQKAITEAIRTVNGAHGKVILISEQAADRTTVRKLQSLSASVWVRTSDSFRSLLTMYTHGVNGVVTDSYQTAFEALDVFQDDAPSLLRQPFVIGHRGDPSNYAENTLESAMGAYEEGADCVENDIYLTKDGELFIRHDSSLGRFLDMPDADGENMTAEQLRSLPFLWDGPNGIPGNNDVSNDNPVYGYLFGGKLFGEEEGYVYRTPFLRDYLTAFKGKDLVHAVEIKSLRPEIIPAYHALVEELDAWDQVFAITFSPEIMEEMYRSDPELSIGALMVLIRVPQGYPYVSIEEVFGKEGAAAAAERLMDALDRWNATCNSPGIPLEVVKAVSHRGMTVWPWTYELPDSAEQFAKDYRNGMHGLTVNEPWIASSFIEEVYSEDAAVHHLNELKRPSGMRRDGKKEILEQAEPVIVRKLNSAGTELLAVWRVREEMEILGQSYGTYYVYSSPFVITLKKETPLPPDEKTTPSDPAVPMEERKAEPPVKRYRTPDTGEFRDLAFCSVSAAVFGLISIVIGAALHQNRKMKRD